MSGYMRFVLMVVLVLAGVVVLAAPQETRLALIDRMYDVGYLNSEEYARHVEKIDPKRKFFSEAGTNGNRMHDGIGAKFLRVPKKG